MKEEDSKKENGSKQKNQADAVEQPNKKQKKNPLVTLTVTPQEPAEKHIKSDPNKEKPKEEPSN